MQNFREEYFRNFLLIQDQEIDGEDRIKIDFGEFQPYESRLHSTVSLLLSVAMVLTVLNFGVLLSDNRLVCSLQVETCRW
jgi:hypothetical protein